MMTPDDQRHMLDKLLSLPAESEVVDYYRNPFLVNAMVSLGMIDTIGSGIRRMFARQRDRRLDLPTLILLDRVQKKKANVLTDEQVRALRQKGAYRRPNYTVRFRRVGACLIARSDTNLINSYKRLQGLYKILTRFSV
ncbi:hypothetical protein GCM10027578_27610 [Spirosoma luteolum]